MRSQNNQNITASSNEKIDGYIDDEVISEASTNQTGSTAIRAMTEQQSRFFPGSQEDTNHQVNGDYYYEAEGDYHDSSPEQPEEFVQDATKAVKESHYALMYLLSNPEEFQSVLSLNQGMKEWNEIDDNISEAASTPLPYAVFASDAEVVLPQAHTASQLFGVETVSGIELEAAAGLINLSQLFLRWLALMPGGDHCNIIDPPGLTVMKISGGRYRVTGAHRVVWTWYNDFLPEAIPSFGSSSSPQSPSTKEDLRFSFDDLVTMTIIDVFETDKDGKLLSYCPTFDNRSITKTNPTRERLSKESHKMKEMINFVSKSKAANQVNRAACFIGRMSLEVAKNMGHGIKEAWHNSSTDPSKASPSKENTPQNLDSDLKEYPLEKSIQKNRRSEHYVSDDETT